MERIQHPAHVGQQCVVVRPAPGAPASTASKPLASGVVVPPTSRAWTMALVALEATITVQEACQQYLKLSPAHPHAKKAPPKSKPSASDGQRSSRGVQPHEARTGVNEALNEPSAGHAIHPKMAARCPQAPLILHAVTAGNTAGLRVEVHRVTGWLPPRW